MYQRTNIRQGMTVMSSDGVQLGRVIDVMADGIIIEKGHFFRQGLPDAPSMTSPRCRGEEIILHERPGGAAARRTRNVQEADVEERRRQATCRLSTPSRRWRRACRTRKSNPPSRPPSRSNSPIPHEPPLAERRAAGPGWDPLSVDEEQEREAARTNGPDPKAPTRY